APAVSPPPTGRPPSCRRCGRPPRPVPACRGAPDSPPAETPRQMLESSCMRPPGVAAELAGGSILESTNISVNCLLGRAARVAAMPPPRPAPLLRAAAPAAVSTCTAFGAAPGSGQGGEQFLDGIGETSLIARYAFDGNAEDT